MAISHLPDTPDIATLTVAELPEITFNDKQDVARQIADHLIKILKEKGCGCPTSLRIPSSLMLGQFYKQSILDVLDGLFELKQQHYEYVMNGLDAEIILHDPLCRTKSGKSVPARHWPLPEMVLSHWDAIQHQSRNPLADILPRKAV
jgi:hypothetical protein